MAYDTITSVVDDLTDNLATYSNQKKTAIDKLMSAAAYASYVRTQSMTANVTLTDADFPIQSFSPTAARDLTLPTVASTNHAFYVVNRSGTYTITVKNSGGTTVYSLTSGSSVLLVSDGTNGWYGIGGSTVTNTYGNLFPHDGVMLNGKLSVTVASNNLTVAIKTLAGTDPSSSDPVYIRINGTVRSLTTSLSVTKNAGTNWCNAGGAELATKEIDYFAYIIWNTTPATDILDIGFSRIPYGNVYSDFSGTTTNEKYLAYGNASAPTSTDDVVNIGRFAATLSAGAGYTWTVPTFTHTNLVQYPILTTRPLTYVPAHLAGGGGYTNAPTTNKAVYVINGYFMDVEVAFTYHATSGGTSYSRITLPYAPIDDAIALSSLNATSGAGGQAQTSSGYVYCYKYDGTTPIVNSNKIGINGKIRISS